MNLDTWTIDYDELLEVAMRSELTIVDTLRTELPAAWTRAYNRSNPHTSRICSIDVEGFEYLFDDARPDTQSLSRPAEGLSSE